MISPQLPPSTATFVHFCPPETNVLFMYLHVNLYGRHEVVLEMRACNDNAILSMVTWPEK